MFTQNQVRQLYVAKAYESNATGLDTAGDIMLQTQENDMYFNFVNADGEVMRTDLINKDKIMSITVTPAAKMKYNSKATYVTLDSNVASGNVVGGEDYMLNIKINRMNWPSEQTPNHKYGIVHGTNSMTASQFYVKMAKSLAANLYRENMLKVGLTEQSAVSGMTNANTTWVNASDSESSFTSTGYTGVIIDEVEQPWSLGKLEQVGVPYEVHSDDIVVSGDEIKWGVETEMKGFTTVENGKDMADLEWFHHGQRGDIYRDAAWPTNWPNKMLVDPTQKYDTIDIHYYWNGANHAIQKSEKDITLVCATGTTSDIVSAINAACSGLTGWSNLSINATGNPSTVILG